VSEALTTRDPAAVAAALRTRFGIAAGPAHRGPVPLARFLDEFNLLHVTLERLTRASIAAYLLGEGIAPGNLLDSGNPDEILAGFIFTTGSDGLVFVGELEPIPSKSGEPPKKPRSTPLGRRRFTAAHELGHFLLHRDRMIGGRWMGDTRETIREEGSNAADMEREADRFAAELLMPAAMCRARAEAFRDTYRVCPLTVFAYHLASELLVSPEALRYRLKGLGVGDE
jgi:hypothetical protein